MTLDFKGLDYTYARKLISMNMFSSYDYIISDDCETGVAADLGGGVRTA